MGGYLDSAGLQKRLPQYTVTHPSAQQPGMVAPEQSHFFWVNQKPIPILHQSVARAVGSAGSKLFTHACSLIGFLGGEEMLKRFHHRGGGECVGYLSNAAKPLTNVHDISWGGEASVGVEKFSGRLDTILCDLEPKILDCL